MLENKIKISKNVFKAKILQKIVENLIMKSFG